MAGGRVWAYGDATCREAVLNHSLTTILDKREGRAVPTAAVRPLGAVSESERACWRGGFPDAARSSGRRVAYGAISALGGRFPLLGVSDKPGDRRPVVSAPVVVGVDGSSSSLDAVEAAAREARLRGCGLRVVHAFIWPALHVPPGPSPLGPAEGGLRNLVGHMMAEAVQRARATAPDVEVTSTVIAGEPLMALEARTHPALIEASDSAQLMAVGARGRGGFAGLLLGSVSQAVLHHARCPVTVVRGTAAPQ